MRCRPTEARLEEVPFLSAVPDPQCVSDGEALGALERENAQLRAALRSRIVVEQAKGVLAERYGLDMDQAFALLRRASRTNRLRIHALAAAVVASRATPPEIQALMVRVAAPQPTELVR